jgi:metal-responsive CopG/Arc/MetJ family transcriptional regulator
MRMTMTVSLPIGTKKKLDSYIAKEHVNRSDVVREALRQYFAREEFQRLRHLLVPEAESQGLYSDEDVFKVVS